MTRRRPGERLHAALSPNGRSVHLATADGHPICGAHVDARCPVHACIGCPGCRRRRPEKAKRLDRRPRVVGLNWDPYYAAIGRALREGATVEPRIRVKYWPVLG